MREPTHHRVPQHAVAAPMAPVVRLHHPTSDHRPLRFDALPGRDEAQLVEPAKGGQIRGSEGSVRHVEVFQMVWCENLHPPKTSTPTR